MHNLLQNRIEEQLSAYQVPYLEKPLSIDAFRITFTDNPATCTIEVRLGFPCAGIKDRLSQELKTLLAPILPDQKISINITAHIEAHTGTQGIKAIPAIKNIIAVGSGKGGVGKSTVAVNLALALKNQGAQVGLLDADIYGPSQPAMLGSQGQQPEMAEGVLKPIESLGLQTMSIGYLIGQDAPMVWRGPMLGKAMQQLINDTAWHNLDYLIIDLPPGTGDVQLTLCQKIPLSGAIMVTTPQDLALLDVRRACAMFTKLNVPLLGIVENMSTYVCSHCGHEEALFGQGGGAELAADLVLPLLGQIPLDPRIRLITDNGKLAIVDKDENLYAKHFDEIAWSASAKLSLKPKDYSSRFPKIVVEKSSA